MKITFLLVINLSQLPNSEYYYSPRGYSFVELDQEKPICTTLINETFPLIRYEVNDILESFPEQVSNISEVEKPIVKKIEGRIEDVIIAKDGTKIGRLNFLFKLKHGGISYAQIIQNKPGQMKINIVPAASFDNSTIHAVSKKVTGCFGENNIDFTINKITMDEIIGSSSNLVGQFFDKYSISRWPC